MSQKSTTEVKPFYCSKRNVELFVQPFPKLWSCDGEGVKRKLVLVNWVVRSSSDEGPTLVISVLCSLYSGQITKISAELVNQQVFTTKTYWDEVSLLTHFFWHCFSSLCFCAHQALIILVNKWIRLIVTCCRNAMVCSHFSFYCNKWYQKMR